MHLYDPQGCLHVRQQQKERDDLKRAFTHGLIFVVALLAIAAFVVAIWS